ncbi:DNA alkylation repair enzyme [hydrothermal vent metagenome]|uniref:DNA alkylation repair enzyme n=1 Tax=hydrothermal vent metagenome TaxID=652676 RepID=A0A3B0Z1C0_9ZZZZ
MAEPLKNSFGPDIPVKIATMIKAVYKQFDSKAFVVDALAVYDELELMQRGKVIAQAMHSHLPSSYIKAIQILTQSLPPINDSLNGAGQVNEDNGSMAQFIYMPHAFYVVLYGMEYFEQSMQAQYEITQRFTAEFSIRGFIERYPQQTLKQLKQWAVDPSMHVRRLVSEGTRPRLPWAQRLPEFQKNPEPVLHLLEMLKDDPELYVRRSVANNLNDIAKDNPKLVIKTLKRWSLSATAEREWLIRHALRTLVKAGNKEALAILGFSQATDIKINKVTLTPKTIRMGDVLTVAFDLKNESSKKQKLLVDMCLHFVKANGETKPKVFKLKSFELASSEKIEISKKISFKAMTTRKHYVGQHHIELIINGTFYSVCQFDLIK